MAGRVSQEVAEVLRQGPPTPRVSQEVIDVLRQGPATVRGSQVMMEVLRLVEDAPPPPTVPPRLAFGGAALRGGS